jgi:hypothetical protein
MTRPRFLMLLLAALLVSAPVIAGDREFHEIVQRIGATCHERPMRGMGLVSFIARPFMPSGVGGLKLAIFEGVNLTEQSCAQDLDSLMQNVAGSTYYPFVRVHSKRDGEQTYIYLHEVKNGSSELLILSVDPGDTVVVKVRIKPEAMKDWMDDPVGQGRSHHDSSSWVDHDD